MIQKTIGLLLVCCFLATAGFAQSVLRVNFVKLEKQHKIVKVNRRSVLYQDEEPILELDEQPNAGFAWLKELTFTNGTIDFDVKGKDLLQQSFVGIAFHAEDEQTYGAIYFRPFNFKADDSVRRSHAVQYISIPKYDWPVLREKFPNKYEQPISPAPDPNDWFHVKMLVAGVTISVYVDHNTKPALIVQQIAKINGNKLGLWVGNGSGGKWKNLVITSDKD